MGFTLGAGYEFLTRPDALWRAESSVFHQMDRGAQKHGPRAFSTRRWSRSK